MRTETTHPGREVMKYVRWVVVILLFMVACNGETSSSTSPVVSPTVSETLPEPDVRVTSVPDPEDTAHEYLQAWQDGNYAAMYGMLTDLSQDAITLEDFTDRYQMVATQANLASVGYEILSSLVSPRSAQVAYRVVLNSAIVGEFSRDTMMNLSMVDNEWQIQWDDVLILPELAGGNLLWMNSSRPSRGDIYDRDGHAIAIQSDAAALFLIPNQINSEAEEDLLTQLWLLTGIRPNHIYDLYADNPRQGCCLPLDEVTTDELNDHLLALSGYSGWGYRDYFGRYYFGNGIAPQTVGYVSSLTAEQLNEYIPLGYQIDDKVGQLGLEAWGEEYLAGRRGGTLYVVDPEGNIVTQLGASQAEPALSMYTNLDRDLQLGAQEAMRGFVGAAVVLERDTGRVLAMVSSPTFDPNAFEPTNVNSSYLLSLFSGYGTSPFLNRATLGFYPPGSVFKVVTIAAALESGLYTADTIYECGYYFTELPGFEGEDWTLAKGFPPSGTLTLPQGLMRSCNPYFWHIGLDLYNQGLMTAVTDMARAFGLGGLTGIEGVDEDSGEIPDPVLPGDAVQQAIGQGAMFVTPLQIVRFIAAIGNDGVMMQPQLVNRIETADGEVVAEYEPVETGFLPISEDNLNIIQNAMYSVVANSRGTAYWKFRGFSVPVAGKTGTATIDAFQESHAWFTGYTFAENPDVPDIAIVVIVENGGEGSDTAAPIFRRIAEIYFFGRPYTRYPWESQIGVTATPSPDETETPTP